MFNKAVCKLPTLLSLTMATALLTSCGGGEVNESFPGASSCINGVQYIDVPLGSAGGVYAVTIPKNATHCYSYYADGGQSYSFTLTTISGDADLALHVNNAFTRTSAISYSTNPSTTVDSLTYSPKYPGTYYVEVYGYVASTYDLVITGP